MTLLYCAFYSIYCIEIAEQYLEPLQVEVKVQTINPLSKWLISCLCGVEFHYVLHFPDVIDRRYCMLRYLIAANYLQPRASDL